MLWLILILKIHISKNKLLIFKCVIMDLVFILRFLQLALIHLTLYFGYLS